MQEMQVCWPLTLRIAVLRNVSTFGHTRIQHYCVQKEQATSNSKYHVSIFKKTQMYLLQKLVYENCANKRNQSMRILFEIKKLKDQDGTGSSERLDAILSTYSNI